jgi:hypothetical protein
LSFIDFSTLTPKARSLIFIASKRYTKIMFLPELGVVWLIIARNADCRGAPKRSKLQA